MCGLAWQQDGVHQAGSLPAHPALGSTVVPISLQVACCSAWPLCCWTRHLWKTVQALYNRTCAGLLSFRWPQAICFLFAYVREDMVTIHTQEEEAQMSPEWCNVLF